MTDESQLVKQLKNGDTEALRRLMTIHQDFVFTVALQMVRAREVAEELTQDVFIKVFQKIGTYEEKSKFSTWLYTITYRTCLNWLEKKKITVAFSKLENEETDSIINTFEDESPLNVLLTENRDMQTILWKAIDQLPVEQGVIISLFYLQQFTVREIAGIMHVPLNTVKTHLFRGRNNLKMHLMDLYSKEELQ